MAFKSIIDIDVNDEKFQAFAVAFDKFVESTADILKRFEDMDKKIGAARDSVSKLGSDVAKRMKEAEKSTHGVTGAFTHMEKSLKRVPSTLHRSTAAFKKFGGEARHVGGILKTVAKTALDFTPVGLALGAISGVLSLFGLGELGNTAMTRMRTAKSMGMKPGSVASIESVMRPVLPDAAGALNAFSAAYTTPLGFGALQRVLGSQAFEHESKSDAFFQMLKKAQTFAKSTPTEALGPMSHALGYAQLGLTVSDLRVLKHTKGSTLAMWEKESKADRGKLAFSSRTAADWAKLSVDLKEAGIQIETVLIKDLKSLGPVIGSISQTFTNWLSNPKIQKSITKFANGLSAKLTKLNKWFKGPGGKKFGADADKVIGELLKVATAAGYLANVVIDVASAIGKIVGFLGGPTTSAGKRKQDLKAAKGEAARAMGTSREAAAHAHYEKLLGKPGHIPWRKIHNPMDIEAYHGDKSYLDKKSGQRYATFSSDAASYRKAESLLKSYHLDTLRALMTRYKGAYHPNMIKVASQVSGFKPNQRLDLSNPQTMALVLTGLARTEQFHARDNKQLYATIHAAIGDGMRGVHIHVHAAPESPQSRTTLQAHTAAR